VESRQRSEAVRRASAALAGVSQKMLIQELKEMVADGVAVRLEYREVPPKVELPAYRPGNVARGSLKPALRVGK
jgi:DNA-binding HxlR family transcriptional regulator